MRRVLFVDDDRSLLEGLRNRLRCMRSRWTMDCAIDGPAALEKLEAMPFDVVVSDMRMRGMEGDELLKRVQAVQPDSVRFVLSGQAGAANSTRAIRYAHQFVAKPCDTDLLIAMIERACEFRDLVTSSAIRSVVGDVESLPTIPRTYGIVAGLLADPDVATGDVAAAIEEDVAMTARILQVVNSALFGLAREISSLRHAVQHLGVSMVRGLILSEGLFSVIDRSRCAKEFSIEGLYTHSIAVGRLARKLLGRFDTRGDAFSAGVLHDAGKLILAVRAPEHYSAAVSLAMHEGIPLHTAEQQVYGFTHADVGALLLALWGLPHPLVEAAADHHAPGRTDASRLHVAGAVHVADRLVHEAAGADDQSVGGLAGELDMAFLESAGVAHRLDEWRQRTASP